MGLLTLADHVHDIAENAVKAGAKNVKLIINETNEFFQFIVEDDGPGIKNIENVFDPFYTTRSKKIRKVGLGLPFLKQATEATGGFVEIESKIGKGTKVSAKFIKKHIDCQPVGDLASVFFALLLNLDVNFEIKRCKNDKCYTLDTETIKKYLGNIDSSTKLKFLKDLIKELEENLEEE
jgi:hypothetical protein